MDNHVSFGNIVFGLASAQPSTGFVGCADFLEYEKKRKKLLYGGAEVWSVRIITKIIIDGTKYRIFTHELK